MFTDTFEYTDYAGNKKTETLNFALTATEVLTVDANYEGGLDGVVKRENSLELMQIIKELITAAYCVPSKDGTKRYKTKEYVEDFISSAVFETVLLRMMSSLEYVEEFFNGCVNITTELPNSLKAAKIETPEMGARIEAMSTSDTQPISITNHGSMGMRSEDEMVRDYLRRNPEFLINELTNGSR